MSLFDELTAATSAARAAKKAAHALIISKLTDVDTRFHKDLLDCFRKAATSGDDRCIIRCCVGTFMKNEGDTEPTDGILTKKEYSMMTGGDFVSVKLLFEETLGIECYIDSNLKRTDNDEQYFVLCFSWTVAPKKRKRLE